MFKKYGKLIFLVIILLITTEITIYVNNNIDAKLSLEQTSNKVEQLRVQLKNSTAEADGMNPYRDYWVYELDYFSTNYPKEREDLFENINMEEWNKSFSDLENKISTVYVDDVTFMSEVSDTIKQYISINYIQDIFDTTYEKGYFRTVMMLMEDDQKNQ